MTTPPKPLPTSGPLLRPPSLVPGSRVGIAALSGPVDPARLEAGREQLELWGFETVPACNLGARKGFLAGDDRERIRGFHQLLLEDVDAVIFARGGHGVLRILGDLDWELIGSRPRWLVGYSDLTPLLLEVSRRLGWQTLHGPMVATDLHRGLSDLERRAFLECLSGSGWPTTKMTPVAGGPNVSEPLTGRLVVGCLSMVCAMLGTPHTPKDLFQDALVLLEDVGESPYRIDRMLTQLRLAGLGSARALIFGHCHERHEQAEVAAGCEDRDVAESSEQVLEVLADQAMRLDLPTWSELGFGHGTPNLALPVGAEGTIVDGCLSIDLGRPSA